MGEITFEEVREANRSRKEKWHPPESIPWSASDWSNALCGEVGEAANIVKKIRRWETQVKGYESQRSVEELVEALGKEIADAYIYLDLLADYFGIDIPEVVVKKFNEVSEMQGFPERL